MIRIERPRLITNVKAIIKDEHGKIIHVQEAANTITAGDPDPGVTHNGLVLLLERLFDSGEIYDPDDAINKMQLGTGTPGNGGLGSPITSPSDTMIAFDSLALDQSAPPSGNWYDAPIMVAICVWDSAFGALSGVTEVGLFADGTDTTLFAYKPLSPGLSKSAGGEISIEWSVQSSYTAP